MFRISRESASSDTIEAAHRQAGFLHQLHNSEPRETLFAKSLGGNGNDALMSSKMLGLYQDRVNPEGALWLSARAVKP